VGQACNLRCKNCGNLAPYSKKESLRYEFDSIKRQMGLFLKHIGELSFLQIQGGEPLLYNNLVDLLQFVGGDNRINKISVTTNGLITPSPELLSAMKKNNIRVDISNYGLFRQRTELNYALYKRSGIDIHYYDFCHGDSTWSELGKSDCIHNEKVQETINRYKV
jgi:molybdenum cofactor biosynthesis enzyme MoaA